MRTAIAALVVFAAAMLGADGAAASVATTQVFTFTGAEQTFTVPQGVTSLHVVAVGGRGGAGYAQGSSSPGAAVAADLSVTPGQTLYIEVGGNGGDAGLGGPGEGGFNGGGAGGPGGGGGGGGASDVRALSRSATESLGSRLITAAGAGGSAGNPMICNGTVKISGGAGGAAGQPGGYGGANSCGGMASAVGWSAGGGDAGSVTAGGGGGYSAGDGLSFFELDPGQDGSFGTGGAGAPGDGGGGGGGGGYFGGGGGGGGVVNTSTMAGGGGGGGGGGSSFLTEGTSNGSVALDPTGAPSVRISYGGAADPSPVVTLTTPVRGSSTNDSTPSFSGTAGTASDDSDTVTLKLYGGTGSTATPVQTHTATRQPDGSWSVTAAPGLADGTYIARAEQSDAAGNTGESSASMFTVDTVTPDPPSLGATLYGNTGLVDLSGTAEAGSIVSVFEGTDRRAGVRADLAGAWAKTLWAPDGPHTYTATATDAAGNASASSKSVTVTVTVTVTIDSTPPTPTITSPADYTTDVTPLIGGTGGAESGDLPTVTVALYRGGSATGSVLQRFDDVAVSSGAWSATPSALTDGTYTAEVRQRDAAGNSGSATRTFTLDATAPAVTTTEPLGGATGVATSAGVSVAFSEAMNTSVAQDAFSLVRSSDGSRVSGTFSWSGSTMRFQPTSALTRGTQYTARISTGARDLAGNPLAAEKSWSFKTIKRNGPIR